MLPASTWRSPTRPLIGAVTRAWLSCSLRVVDLAFVDLDHPLVLPHQGPLGIDLLARDRILLEQGFVAPEVDARVLQLGAIARQLALGLGQLHLQLARVDLGQQLAFLDEVALLEVHPLQQPRNPGLDRRRLRRHHRAQGIDDDRHVAHLGGDGNHRRARDRRPRPPPGGGAALPARRHPAPAPAAAPGSGRGLRQPAPVASASSSTSRRPPPARAPAGAATRRGCGAHGQALPAGRRAAGGGRGSPGSASGARSPSSPSPRPASSRPARPRNGARAPPSSPARCRGGGQGVVVAVGERLHG